MNRLILDLVIPHIYDLHTFYIVLDAIYELPLTHTQSIKDLKPGTLCFGYDTQMRLDELITTALRIKSFLILEWAYPRAGGPPWYYPNTCAAEWCCREGDLNNLKQLYEKKCIRRLEDDAITALFKHAHFPILEWIDTIDIGLSWRRMPYRYATHWESDYMTCWLYRNCHRNILKHSWESYFDSLPDAFLIDTDDTVTQLFEFEIQSILIKYIEEGS